MPRTSPLARPSDSLARGLRQAGPASRGATSAAVAIRGQLPMGWMVTLSQAYSPHHLDVMITIWVCEATMGWKAWHCARTLDELVTWALGYVDECMASCVPDEGQPPVTEDT